MNSKPFLTDSFFTLNGIFVGIGLNDWFRLTNSPLNNQPIVVGGIDTDYDQDFLIQLAVGGLFILAEYFGGLKYASKLGYGMILGSTWANASESETKNVSITPF